MGFVVGLTGGIGSGKSTVARCFIALGIAEVDADIVAREVVEPGQPALARIFDRFGSELRQTDGGLDRAALRRIVFESPAERRWLESLLHPLIREQIKTQLAAACSPYVLLVSPLLLETDQHRMVDHVLVVDVPEELQLQRTMARDNNDETQVRAIMASQLPRSERLARADSVLDNSASPVTLEQQVAALDTKFRALAADHSR